MDLHGPLALPVYLLVFGLWIAPPIIIGRIAAHRGASAPLYVILGCFLGWAAFLLLFTLPKRSTPNTPET